MSEPKVDRFLLTLLVMVVAAGAVMGVSLSGVADGAERQHQPERVWSEQWCEQVGGKSSGVTLDDGTVPDCVTGSHAIEVDFARKWYEGVGQALHYARLSGLRPGLMLIVEDEAEDCRYVERARLSVPRMLVLVDGQGLVPVSVWIAGGRCE